MKCCDAGVRATLDAAVTPFDAHWPYAQSVFIVRGTGLSGTISIKQVVSLAMHTTHNHYYDGKKQIYFANGLVVHFEMHLKLNVLCGRHPFNAISSVSFCSINFPKLAEAWSGYQRYSSGGQTKSLDFNFDNNNWAVSGRTARSFEWDGRRGAGEGIEAI